MALTEALRRLAANEDLSAATTQEIFDEIFAGRAQREDIATLLLGLHRKGETVEEILGAARSMRANMLSLPAPANAIDIVGTGGDNHGTLNISTATALVVAGCGVPVAKHGNRAATSRSGSSDALKMLGINLEPDWAILERCLPEVGLVFLFAPRHHPAMRHVVEIRRELGVRTIFNRLGPLTNPANVKRHLIGAYDLESLGPMAEALRELGSEYAWLAHGHDGMDEISTTGPTDIVEMHHSQLKHFTLTPEELGLPRARLEDLKGGDPAANAEALRHLLNGATGAYRDITLMNAAAALIVAGKTTRLREGVAIVAEAIDSGAARQKLEALIRLTNA